MYTKKAKGIIIEFDHCLMLEKQLHLNNKTAAF